MLRPTAGWVPHSDCASTADFNRETLRRSAREKLSDFNKGNLNLEDVELAAFSRDGSRLALYRRNGSIYLLDAVRIKSADSILQRIQADGAVRAMRFSDDERFLEVATGDADVQVTRHYLPPSKQLVSEACERSGRNHLDPGEWVSLIGQKPTSDLPRASEPARNVGPLPFPPGWRGPSNGQLTLDNSDFAESSASVSVNVGHVGPRLPFLLSPVRHGGPTSSAVSLALTGLRGLGRSPVSESGPRGGRPGLNSTSGRNLLVGLLAATRLKLFLVVGSKSYPARIRRPLRGVLREPPGDEAHSVLPGWRRDHEVRTPGSRLVRSTHATCISPRVAKGVDGRGTLP